MNTSWHSLSVQQVFKKLSTSENGLTADEAKGRVEKFGRNKLPEPKRFTRVQIFLRQFKSPLIYLLVVAGVVSFALGEVTDSYIIFAAVILTVAFGYLQEQKAEGSLKVLEKMVRHTARLIREGKEGELEASQLVPGDIILLASGDKVAADVRLVSGKNLEIEESPLTGEAMPISKLYAPLDIGIPVPERTNMAFMGTIVSRGRAMGIVVETGVRTQFGKIAESLSAIVEEPTPFQKKVERFARWISLLLLAIVLLIFTGGLVRGIEFAEIFAASVAVAVSAVPESLVIAVTVILATGMVRLLREKALVRKLISAETLGGTTVICSDKTGTLTEGRMKVLDVYTESGADSRELALEIAMIANEAYVENPKEDIRNWKIHGDPTERALIQAGIEAGLAKRFLESEERILDEMPFESENQYMATLMKHKIGNMPVRRSVSEGGKHGMGNVIYYKGAPEKILGASQYIHDSEAAGGKKQLHEQHVKKLEKIFEDFSYKGLRVLAVAYRKVGNNEAGPTSPGGRLPKLSEFGKILEGLTFVGLIAIHDPIREGVRTTIEVARAAGIKIVMITGDHKFTAMSIAKELGLALDHEKIMEGEDLAKIDDATLQKEVKNISVYARILPHDKLRIIEAFQKNGEVVAMTGDGVNDAPALKKADIGIAMGTGTDVAKEASDMIILDNNFKSIVRAVEQGRMIFDNLRKVVTYLLADSFTEIVLIGGSVVAGLPLPVLAGQILWVNLVADGFPAFALSYEPKEKDVMKLAPLGRKAPILDRQMKVIIFIVGIITDLILLGLFILLFRESGNIEYARTMVFSALAVDSLLYIFCIKSLRNSILRINLLNNPFLVGSVLFGFAMVALALYVPFFQTLLRTVPLGAGDWGIIAVLGAAEILCIEVAKKMFIPRSRAVQL